MLNPGDLDGFHPESSSEASLREFAAFLRNTDFDPNAMRDDAAMRAVWILVKHGAWSELTSLGVNRQELEPKLVKVSHYKEKVSDRQVWRLQRLYPELVDASVVLRILYYLKYNSREGL